METSINNQLEIQLQSLWSIESMLVEAMPRMIANAGNTGLIKNLSLHFEETRQHKVAIEAICKGLGLQAKGGEPNRELQSVLQQGEQLMIGKSSGDELDAAIISSAKEIEQVEIAAYYAAGNTAREMGYEGISKRLFLTLEEERQSHTKLGFLEKALFSERSYIGLREHVTVD